MPKIMLFAHDTEYVYFWNDSAIPGPNPMQDFVIIHSSLELSTQKIEKKKKKKRNYCTILNCSARGVTCDHVDEFVLPARCNVTWDMSENSAN